LMKKPITEAAPVSMSQYAKANTSWHIWGMVGGIIWCTGAVFNFVASHARIVGPAISYAIGQGATMVSAVWGVFVWREFENAPTSTRMMILAMFFFFLLGLASIAVAPMFAH
jgi:glucose uptake protein